MQAYSNLCTPTHSMAGHCHMCVLFPYRRIMFLHTALTWLFQCPQTPDEWREVAKDYWRRWNFPNCLGALDGKHIMIRQPACSGSKFFNYKHTFSVILLAVADAEYKFIFCDVGSQGKCSDGGIFAQSELNHAVQRNALGVPEAAALPGRNDAFPFCFVADDAFPLTDYIMKPYPHRNLSNSERIFNYRLSRARRCVESAFGIMASRFRVLLHPMCLRPAKVDAVVLACCALHNMLRTLAPSKYGGPQDDYNATGTNQGSSSTIPGARVGGRRSATNAAKEMRQYLCNYFMSPQGSVSWQDEMVKL